MGLRFRKSFGLVPGVRLNIGKRSASIRIGGRGFGVTSGTAGTRATIGVPGTGVSYTTKIANGRSGGGPDRAPGRIVTALVIVVVVAALIGWLL